MCLNDYVYDRKKVNEEKDKDIPCNRSGTWPSTDKRIPEPVLSIEKLNGGRIPRENDSSTLAVWCAVEAFETIRYLLNSYNGELD